MTLCVSTADGLLSCDAAGIAVKAASTTAVTLLRGMAAVVEVVAAAVVVLLQVACRQVLVVVLLSVSCVLVAGVLLVLCCYEVATPCRLNEARPFALGRVLISLRNCWFWWSGQICDQERPEEDKLRPLNTEQNTGRLRRRWLYRQQ